MAQFYLGVSFSGSSWFTGRLKRNESHFLLVEPTLDFFFFPQVEILIKDDILLRLHGLRSPFNLPSSCTQKHNKVGNEFFLSTIGHIYSTQPNSPLNWKVKIALMTQPMLAELLALLFNPNIELNHDFLISFFFLRRIQNCFLVASTCSQTFD